MTWKAMLPKWISKWIVSTWKSTQLCTTKYWQRSTALTSGASIQRKMTVREVKSHIRRSCLYHTVQKAAEFRTFKNYKKAKDKSAQRFQGKRPKQAFHTRENRKAIQTQNMLNLFNNHGNANVILYCQICKSEKLARTWNKRNSHTQQEGVKITLEASGSGFLVRFIISSILYLKKTKNET